MDSSSPSPARLESGESTIKFIPAESNFTVEGTSTTTNSFTEGQQDHLLMILNKIMQAHYHAFYNAWLFKVKDLGCKILECSLVYKNITVNAPLQRRSFALHGFSINGNNFEFKKLVSDYGPEKRPKKELTCVDILCNTVSDLVKDVVHNSELLATSQK
jgi:hypothetical protein